MTEKISGGAFKQMVAFGAACITAQKQAINDLNVFPVPDGDTGTNMSLTIQTAVNELRKAEPATVDEAAKLTASGLLRGARGNSGVILSLLFRGMSKVLKGHDTSRRRPAGRGHAGGRFHCLRRGDEARRGHGPHRLPPGRPACAARPPARRTTPSSYWTRPSRPAIPPWRRPSR